MKETAGENGMHAVRGTAIVCFAAAVIGDLILLFPVLDRVLLKEHRLPFVLEVISWGVLVYAIIWLCRHKMGWGTVKSKVIVFGLFGLYVLYSVLFYTEFQAAYMTYFSKPSVAGAMVGIKLFLVLIGITAGIPTGPRIDSREYAHRLREKALQQEAGWAKEAVKGARRDLQATIDKLKNTLSPEELQALMEELQATGTSGSGEKAADASATPSEGVRTEDVRDGWGGGI